MAPAVCYFVVDFVFPFQPGTWYMCVADREIGLSQGLDGHSTRLVQSFSFNVMGISIISECLITPTNFYRVRASWNPSSRPLLRLSGSQPKSNRRTPLVSTPLSKMKRPAAIAAVSPFAAPFRSGDQITTGTSWHAHYSPMYDCNLIAVVSPVGSTRRTVRHRRVVQNYGSYVIVGTIK